MVVGSLIVPGALGHAWITSPVSRIEMVTHHYQDGMPDNGLQWCPSCSAGPNACFAQGGENDWVKDIGVWQKWYDAAGVSVPHLTGGQDVAFHWTTTAEHGGQAWVQISCDTSFAENNTWHLLKRGDSRGRLPSSAHLSAWGQGGSGGHASWVVPSGFSCPFGHGIGRWIWKTGNSCQDVYNYGRKTEMFDLKEMESLGVIGHGACVAACEEFGSCFDFTTNVGPAPPPPAPTPAPPPPMGPCHAISPRASDAWCEQNCHFTGSNCPADLCKCDPLPPPTPTPPTPPPPSGCHALTPVVSDAWCTANCINPNPHCPADLCRCDPARDALI